MNRWLTAALVVLALGMLQGLLDPANETDAKITAEAAGRAIASREAIGPQDYFPRRLTHPVTRCYGRQFVAQRSDPHEPWDFACTDADLSRSAR